MTDQAPEKSKQGLYRLHDKSLRLLGTKYIFPTGAGSIGNADYVLKAIRGTFDLHVAGSYEDACRDICKRLMADGAFAVHGAGKVVVPGTRSSILWRSMRSRGQSILASDVERKEGRRGRVPRPAEKGRSGRLAAQEARGEIHALQQIRLHRRHDRHAGKEGVLLLHKDKVVQRKRLLTASLKRSNNPGRAGQCRGYVLGVS